MASHRDQEIHTTRHHTTFLCNRRIIALKHRESSFVYKKEVYRFNIQHNCQIQDSISSITVRNDLDLSKQISTANEELQKMCSKNGFDFIKNNNIDAVCLNGGLLHLNSKGSAFLATNFIKFLRGNIPAASEYRQRKRGEDFQGHRTYQNHSLEDLLRLLLLAQRTEY